MVPQPLADSCDSASRRELARLVHGWSSARVRGRRSAVAIAIVLMYSLSACLQASPSRSSQAVGASSAPGATASETPGAPGTTGIGVHSPGAIRITIARSDIRLPAPLSRAVALAFGSAILVCGGLASDGSTSGSIIRIELSSGRASIADALADPVHDAGGAVLNGSGFIFGGGATVPVSVVQQVGPGAAASVVGQLPSSRADLVSVVVDGELLVVGGGTPTRDDVSVLATTDGNTFRVVARLLVGVRYPAVAVESGVVYVIGGRTGVGDSAVIQAIDPRTGVVRIVGHLSHGLSHASAFVVGGVLFIAGGRTAGVAQDAVWRFDVARGTAAEIGRLPYRVSDMAAVVSGGNAYLIGGEESGPVASIITVTPQ